HPAGTPTPRGQASVALYQQKRSGQQHHPPDTFCSCSSLSSSSGWAGSTRWTTLPVFSTARTSTPSGTDIPCSRSTCTGCCNSLALNSSSAHAFATICAYCFCCSVGLTAMGSPPVEHMYLFRKRVEIIVDRDGTMNQGASP